MTTINRGNKFWHCRHVFQGRTLLTFGRTKWAAEKRMTYCIARNPASRLENNGG